MPASLIDLIEKYQRPEPRPSMTAEVSSGSEICIGVKYRREAVP